MTRLSDYLAGAGLVPVEMLRSAMARQAVYGGALDTALLEVGAIEEGRLWQALGAATGLPLPPPRLYETPIRFRIPAGAAVELDVRWSERWRGVPVAQPNGELAVLCGEPVARAELEAAGAALGVRCSLFVAPEVRLAALRQTVYGRAMPPRLAQLFARVAGSLPFRRWQAAQARASGHEAGVAASAPAAAGPTGVSPGEVRSSELAAASPAPAQIPASAPASTAVSANRADKAEIAALLERLDDRGEQAAKAHSALVHLTKQDFGLKRRRWQAWWDKHQDDARVEWLFEGLAHKQPEIRASAEEELRALTGEYFGYHFDLPRPDREQAAARWQSWWYESGRARRR
jgi:hypothetical protein